MHNNGTQTKPVLTDEARLSLERAFHIFEEQGKTLEKAYAELQRKLNEAQLSLAEKNRELAQKVTEIENMRERLAGILESINDAVFLVDTASGRTDMANKAASELFASMEKAEIALLQNPDIDAMIKSGNTVKNSMVIIKGRYDKYNFMVSVIPLHDQGPVSGVLVTIKDLSELASLQERVSREDRLAALGRVAASVAHEIRNPLSAIEGFAVLLQRDLKDMPNQQRLAAKTIYAARQLNSVVSNLLNYTREMKSDAALCDLRYLVMESLEFVRPMADDHKVEIKIEMPASAMHTRIDPVQFRQVVSNITVNAVEACPMRAGGKIQISGKLEDKYLFIEIEDNGGGIPDSKKKKIFEPFFTMKEGGIGLGLALCQRIIESHGGEIYECGEDGKGAKFVIKLKQENSEK